ncbi:MAG: hypothetical protein ACP5OA_00930, partial [Candidatus Woesearchaeota archaeon]
RYYQFIDALIYLVLFLSLAQLVFTKIYSNNKREAKMVAVAIALSLMFAMVVLENMTGFNLGQLAPVALVIFLSVLAMLLYNLLQGLFGSEGKGKTASAALTYLLVYGLLVVPFNTLNQWIITNSPLLASVLSLASVVAFIYLLIQLFSALGLGGGGGKTTPDPYYNPRPEYKPTIEPEPEKPKPPKPDDPVYPDDLRELIGKSYATALNDLANKYQEYAKLFNAIIQMHHDALTSPNREPNVTEWTGLLNLRTELIKDLKDANKILDAINRHPEYAKLSSTDITALATLMNGYRRVFYALMKYEITARQAFNHRAVPPAIPQP